MCTLGIGTLYLYIYIYTVYVYIYNVYILIKYLYMYIFVVYPHPTEYVYVRKSNIWPRTATPPINEKKKYISIFFLYMYLYLYYVCTTYVYNNNRCERQLIGRIKIKNTNIYLLSIYLWQFCITENIKLSRKLFS